MLQLELQLTNEIDSSLAQPYYQLLCLLSLVAILRINITGS